MPLPVRVAAGLVITALEKARRVPEQLAELPVTAASRAVQTGMRIQQQVTKLAIKGDEVFALFRPVQDTPPWARFDEDDESPDQPGTQAPPGSGPDINGRGEIDEAHVAQKMTPQRPVDVDRTPPQTAGHTRTEAAQDEPEEPTVLPGYAQLTLAQLRGKLRALSLAELEALLEHEQAHRDRAPFITMLSNRISTVRSR